MMKTDNNDDGTVRIAFYIMTKEEDLEKLAELGRELREMYDKLFPPQDVRYIVSPTTGYLGSWIKER